jgi:hypothetical protein
MGRACSTNDMKNAYRLLVERAEITRPIGRRGCLWVDNIKMETLEIERGGMDWIDRKIGTILRLL